MAHADIFCKLGLEICYSRFLIMIVEKNPQKVSRLDKSSVRVFALGDNPIYAL